MSPALADLLRDSDSLCDFLYGSALGKAGVSETWLRKVAASLSIGQAVPAARPDELLVLALIDHDATVRIAALDALRARYAAENDSALAAIEARHERAAGEVVDLDDESPVVF